MRDVETIRAYCLSKKGTTESLPFGDDTLVFKVMDKIYLLLSLENSTPSFNAKCDPEKALELRANHSQIKPGYHMNKKHWNTISVDNQLSNGLILELIDHSYEMVLAGLSKKSLQELQQIE